jgi:hypothetical protein
MLIKSKTMNNKTFIQIVKAYLVTVNKDREWLLSQTGFTVMAWRNWANGFKNPSLDAINSIALVLKNVGANIWTPKQLMPEGMTFGFDKSKVAACNIPYLCETYRVSASDIYNETKYQLPKNSVLNVISKKIGPGSENLNKFANFFIKTGKGNIKSAADLIYFPVPWGETEKSYLEIRGKIKLI